MKLRYVFSERPYVMALKRRYLGDHCSNCAARSTTIECAEKCGRVSYCDDECSTNDRPFHVHECKAFRRGKKIADSNVDMTVRALGRTVARYLLDGGSCVLSDDFPRHLSEDRCFDDLMTHRRMQLFNYVHERTLRIARKAYYQFFEGTALGKTSASMLRTCYDRHWINGFSLMPQGTTLGNVLYLNASRFNHSCRPTCLYRFEGARIVVEYIDRGNEEATEEDEDGQDDGPARFTKEQFEALTFTYGFNGEFNYNCSYYSTNQRRKSLRSYFFVCRCVMCSDKVSTSIEANAANVECDRCKMPYVWDTRVLGITLKRRCRCSNDDRDGSADMQGSKIMAIKFGRDAARDVKKLMRQWPTIMRRLSSTSANPKEAIESSRDTLKLAVKYWHPTRNLRLGQLYEKIFDVLLAEGKAKTSPSTADEINFALMIGERMLAIYSYYFQPFMLATARLAKSVGELYQARANGPADLARSRYWFEFAIKTYEDRKKPYMVAMMNRKMEGIE